MTILFTEGFDNYTNGSSISGPRAAKLDLGDRYTASNTALTDNNYLTFVNGQSGGYALRSGTNTAVSNSLVYVLPSPLTTLCFGVLHQSLTGTGCIVRLANTSTSFIQFRLVSNVPTVITPTNNYPADPMYTIVDPWNYYEIKVEVLGLTANVNCWLNGVLILTLPGITWVAAGNQQIEQFTFGKVSGDTASVGSQHYDNVYITDGENLGPIEIKLIRPKADTPTKQWTRSTGNDNYSLVNDDVLLDNGGIIGTPTMNTYVQATVPGQKDIYELESIGTMYSDYDILAISPLSFSSRPSGTQPVLTSLYDTNNDRHNLATFLPIAGGDGNLKNYTPIGTNPFTLSAWSIDDINSLRLGIEHDPIPDVPSDPFWDDVLLLANFDDVTSTATGNLHDMTKKSNAQYGNGIAVDTTNAQVGFGRVVRNNASTNNARWCNIVPNDITSTINDWTFNDEFTVEFWFRPLSYQAAGKGILGVKDTTANMNAVNFQWMVSDWNDARGLTLDLSINNTIQSISLNDRASVVMPVNTWHFNAFGRDSAGYVRWFINGNMVGKIGPFLDPIVAVGFLRLFNRNVFDGGDSTATSFNNGAFDDIRITKKSRYNDDGPIAVPTSPFPRP